MHGGGIHQRWLQRARAPRTAHGVTIAIANDIIALRRERAICRTERASLPPQVPER